MGSENEDRYPGDPNFYNLLYNSDDISLSRRQLILLKEKFRRNTTRNIAISQLRRINQATRFIRTSKDFVTNVRKELQLLQCYNDSVFKRRRRFPYTKWLNMLLERYVALEYEFFTAQGGGSKLEEETSKRIICYLHMMLKVPNAGKDEDERAKMMILKIITSAIIKHKVCKKFCTRIITEILDSVDVLNTVKKVSRGSILANNIWFNCGLSRLITTDNCETDSEDSEAGSCDEPISDGSDTSNVSIDPDILHAEHVLFGDDLTIKTPAIFQLSNFKQEEEDEEIDRKPVLSQIDLKLVKYESSSSNSSKLKKRRQRTMFKRSANEEKQMHMLGDNFVCKTEKLLKCRPVFKKPEVVAEITISDDDDDAVIVVDTPTVEVTIIENVSQNDDDQIVVETSCVNSVTNDIKSEPCRVKEIPTLLPECLEIDITKLTLNTVGDCEKVLKNNEEIPHLQSETAVIELKTSVINEEASAIKTTESVIKLPNANKEETPTPIEEQQTTGINEQSIIVEKMQVESSSIEDGKMESSENNPENIPNITNTNQNKTDSENNAVKKPPHSLDDVAASLEKLIQKDNQETVRNKNEDGDTVSTSSKIATTNPPPLEITHDEKTKEPLISTPTFTTSNDTSIDKNLDESAFEAKKDKNAKCSSIIAKLKQQLGKPTNTKNKKKKKNKNLTNVEVSADTCDEPSRCEEFNKNQTIEITNKNCDIVSKSTSNPPDGWDCGEIVEPVESTLPSETGVQHSPQPISVDRTPSKENLQDCNETAEIILPLETTQSETVKDGTVAQDASKFLISPEYNVPKFEETDKVIWPSENSNLDYVQEINHVNTSIIQNDQLHDIPDKINEPIIVQETSIEVNDVSKQDFSKVEISNEENPPICQRNLHEENVQVIEESSKNIMPLEITACEAAETTKAIILCSKSQIPHEENVAITKETTENDSNSESAAQLIELNQQLQSTILEKTAEIILPSEIPQIETMNNVQNVENKTVQIMEESAEGFSKTTSECNGEIMLKKTEDISQIKNPTSEESDEIVFATEIFNTEVVNTIKEIVDTVVKISNDQKLSEHNNSSMKNIEVAQTIADVQNTTDEDDDIAEDALIIHESASDCDKMNSDVNEEVEQEKELPGCNELINNTVQTNCSLEVIEGSDNLNIVEIEVNNENIIQDSNVCNTITNAEQEVKQTENFEIDNLNTEKPRELDTKLQVVEKYGTSLIHSEIIKPTENAETVEEISASNESREALDLSLPKNDSAIAVEGSNEITENVSKNYKTCLVISEESNEKSFMHSSLIEKASDILVNKEHSDELIESNAACATTSYNNLPCEKIKYDCFSVLPSDVPSIENFTKLNTRKNLVKSEVISMEEEVSLEAKDHNIPSKEIIVEEKIKKRLEAFEIVVAEGVIPPKCDAIEVAPKLTKKSKKINSNNKDSSNSAVQFENLEQLATLAIEREKITGPANRSRLRIGSLDTSKKKNTKKLELERQKSENPQHAQISNHRIDFILGNYDTEIIAKPHFKTKGELKYHKNPDETSSSSTNDANQLPYSVTNLLKNRDIEITTISRGKNETRKSISNRAEAVPPLIRKKLEIEVLEKETIKQQKLSKNHLVQKHIVNSEPPLMQENPQQIKKHFEELEVPQLSQQELEPMDKKTKPVIDIAKTEKSSEPPIKNTPKMSLKKQWKLSRDPKELINKLNNSSPQIVAEVAKLLVEMVDKVNKKTKDVVQPKKQQNLEKRKGTKGNKIQKIADKKVSKIHEADHKEKGIEEFPNVSRRSRSSSTHQQRKRSESRSSVESVEPEQRKSRRDWVEDDFETDQELDKPDSKSNKTTEKNMSFKGKGKTQKTKNKQCEFKRRSRSSKSVEFDPVITDIPIKSKQKNKNDQIEIKERQQVNDNKKSPEKKVPNNTSCRTRSQDKINAQKDGPKSNKSVEKIDEKSTIIDDEFLKNESKSKTPETKKTVKENVYKSPQRKVDKPEKANSSYKNKKDSQNFRQTRSQCRELENLKLADMVETIKRRQDSSSEIDDDAKKIKTETPRTRSSRSSRRNKDKLQEQKEQKSAIKDDTDVEDWNTEETKLKTKRPKNEAIDIDKDMKSSYAKMMNVKVVLENKIIGKFGEIKANQNSNVLKADEEVERKSIDRETVKKPTNKKLRNSISRKDELKQSAKKMEKNFTKETNSDITIDIIVKDMVIETEKNENLTNCDKKRKNASPKKSELKLTKVKKDSTEKCKPSSEVSILTTGKKHTNISEVVDNIERKTESKTKVLPNDELDKVVQDTKAPKVSSIAKTSEVTNIPPSNDPEISSIEKISSPTSEIISVEEVSLLDQTLIIHEIQENNDSEIIEENMPEIYEETIYKNDSEPVKHDIAKIIASSSTVGTDDRIFNPPAAIKECVEIQNEEKVDSKSTPPIKTDVEISENFIEEEKVVSKPTEAINEHISVVENMLEEETDISKHASAIEKRVKATENILEQEKIDSKPIEAITEHIQIVENILEEEAVISKSVSANKNCVEVTENIAEEEKVASKPRKALKEHIEVVENILEKPTVVSKSVPAIKKRVEVTKNMPAEEKVTSKPTNAITKRIVESKLEEKTVLSKSVPAIKKHVEVIENTPEKEKVTLKPTKEEKTDISKSPPTIKKRVKGTENILEDEKVASKPADDIKEHIEVVENNLEKIDVISKSIPTFKKRAEVTEKIPEEEKVTPQSTDSRKKRAEVAENIPEEETVIAKSTPAIKKRVRKTGNLLEERQVVSKRTKAKKDRNKVTENIQKEIKVDSKPTLALKKYVEVVENFIEEETFPINETQTFIIENAIITDVEMMEVQLATYAPNFIIEEKIEIVINEQNSIIEGNILSKIPDMPSDGNLVILDDISKLRQLKETPKETDLAKKKGNSKSSAKQENKVGRVTRHTKNRSTFVEEIQATLFPDCNQKTEIPRKINPVNLKSEEISKVETIETEKVTSENKVETTTIRKRKAIEINQERRYKRLFTETASDKRRSVDDIITELRACKKIGEGKISSKTKVQNIPVCTDVNELSSKPITKTSTASTIFETNDKSIEDKLDKVANQIQASFDATDTIKAPTETNVKNEVIKAMPDLSIEVPQMPDILNETNKTNKIEEALNVGGTNTEVEEVVSHNKIVPEAISSKIVEDVLPNISAASETCVLPKTTLEQPSPKATKEIFHKISLEEVSPKIALKEVLPKVAEVVLAEVSPKVALESVLPEVNEEVVAEEVSNEIVQKEGLSEVPEEVFPKIVLQEVLPIVAEVLPEIAHDVEVLSTKPLEEVLPEVPKEISVEVSPKVVLEVESSPQVVEEVSPEIKGILRKVTEEVIAEEHKLTSKVLPEVEKILPKVASREKVLHKIGVLKDLPEVVPKSVQAEEYSKVAVTEPVKITTNIEIETTPTNVSLIPLPFNVMTKKTRAVMSQIHHTPTKKTKRIPKTLPISKDFPHSSNKSVMEVVEMITKDFDDGSKKSLAFDEHLGASRSDNTASNLSLCVDKPSCLSSSSNPNVIVEKIPPLSPIKSSLIIMDQLPLDLPDNDSSHSSLVPDMYKTQQLDIPSMDVLPATSGINIINNQLLTSTVGLCNPLDTMTVSYITEMHVSSTQQPIYVDETPLSEKVKACGSLLVGNGTSEQHVTYGDPLVSGHMSNKPVTKAKEDKLEGSRETLDASPVDENVIFPFSEQVCLIDNNMAQVESRSLDNSPVDGATDYPFSEQDNHLGFGFNNYSHDCLITSDSSQNIFVPNICKEEIVETEGECDDFTKVMTVEKMSELFLNNPLDYLNINTASQKCITGNVPVDLEGRSTINFSDIAYEQVIYPVGMKGNHPFPLNQTDFEVEALMYQDKPDTDAESTSNDTEETTESSINSAIKHAVDGLFEIQSANSSNSFPMSNLGLDDIENLTFNENEQAPATWTQEEVIRTKTESWLSETVTGKTGFVDLIPFPEPKSTDVPQTPTEAPVSETDALVSQTDSSIAAKPTEKTDLKISDIKIVETKTLKTPQTTDKNESIALKIKQKIKTVPTRPDRNLEQMFTVRRNEKMQVSAPKRKTAQIPVRKSPPKEIPRVDSPKTVIIKDDSRDLPILSSTAAPKRRSTFTRNASEVIDVKKTIPSKKRVVTSTAPLEAKKSKASTDDSSDDDEFFKKAKQPSVLTQEQMDAMQKQMDATFEQLRKEEDVNKLSKMKSSVPVNNERETRSKRKTDIPNENEVIRLKSIADLRKADKKITQKSPNEDFEQVKKTRPPPSTRVMDDEFDRVRNLDVNELPIIKNGITLNINNTERETRSKKRTNSDFITDDDSDKRKKFRFNEIIDPEDVSINFCKETKLKTDSSKLEGKSDSKEKKVCYVNPIVRPSQTASVTNNTPRDYFPRSEYIPLPERPQRYPNRPYSSNNREIYSDQQIYPRRSRSPSTPRSSRRHPPDYFHIEPSHMPPISRQGSSGRSNFVNSRHYEESRENQPHYSTTRREVSPETRHRYFNFNNMRHYEESSSGTRTHSSRSSGHFDEGSTNSRHRYERHYTTSSAESAAHLSTSLPAESRSHHSAGHYRAPYSETKSNSESKVPDMGNNVGESSKSNRPWWDSFKTLLPPPICKFTPKRVVSHNDFNLHGSTKIEVNNKSSNRAKAYGDPKKKGETD